MSASTTRCACGRVVLHVGRDVGKMAVAPSWRSSSLSAQSSSSAAIDPLHDELVLAGGGDAADPQILDRHDEARDARDLPERAPEIARGSPRAAGVASASARRTGCPVLAVDGAEAAADDRADMRDIGLGAERGGHLSLQRRACRRRRCPGAPASAPKAGRCPPAAGSPLATWRRGRRVAATVPKKSSRIERPGAQAEIERRAVAAQQPARAASRVRHVASAGARSRRLGRRAQSIGVKVSETSAEATIEIVTTMANSLKMRPMTPPISRIGRKTATSETVIETIVKPTSRLPTSAASNGFMPSSMWRTMFSSMTMASSTTSPTASVSPSSEMLSMEKPSTYITANVAMSEIGTASVGMSGRRDAAQEQEDDERDQPDGERQRQLARRARPAMIEPARSLSTLMLPDGPRSAANFGSIALTRSTTSTVFASG